VGLERSGEDLGLASGCPGIDQDEDVNAFLVEEPYELRDLRGGEAVDVDGRDLEVRDDR
jgi:hypothetical protein